MLLTKDFPNEKKFYKLFNKQKQSQEVFYKSIQTTALKNAGEHLCWSLAKAFNFIKKRLQNRSFPVNIANFLRNFIIKNTCKRQLPNKSTVK